jgi:hypothetical protein
MRTHLRNFSFPMSVLGDLVLSGYLIASVRVPDRVPDYALQAEAVYRLEVGASCFVVLYLAAMALFLALDGRGFAEFGTRGLRPTKVARAGDEQRVMVSEQVMHIRSMGENLKQIEAVLNSALAELEIQDQRLGMLEEERRGHASG